MDYPQPAKSIDELPPRYEGLARERHWQDYWRACGVYDFSPTRPDGTPRTREELYTVDTPPPTVSGALHIGHVFSYTQTDFSVRYQRMTGKHVFYPFGFDDNGLPSERLVERVTGKRAFEVGREEFITLCEPIIKSAEQEFIDLWQSLALSCDWTQFYTTINARSRAISQASFIDLYRKGFIYRKEAPTQWCWADQTAIAQAEVEDKEVAGHFHDIVFHFDDGSGQLTPVTIATTRPELIPACVAVFAHPDDARYQHLFGKVAVTPLFEVEVPILPSEKADPEKGTGILMCCTFGDTEDVEHWEQFHLPTRVIVGKPGRLEDFAANYVPAAARPCALDGERYSDERHTALSTQWPSRRPEQAQRLAAELAGKKIKDARAVIREQLQAAGLLREVREITHIVRHSERGGVPIEILVTPQWYVSVLKYKRELIEQGRKVKWHPEYMLKRFEHWVDGLNQDWCISRQRYNGVPFPVWYAGSGAMRRPILASVAQLPVNPLVDRPDEAALKADRELNGPLYGYCDRTGVDPLAPLDPEPDVMDTWATSSVTPLLNTHLIIGQDDAATAARHAQIFPYDLRPQAHDIIRTWAFYTIAKAYFHFGTIPWKDIVISGHAQDAGRKKISKSKGHVVTPAEMVEKYTADGLRYWSSGCKLGTDTIYDEQSLGDGKRLITKLFNASKFALRHLLDFDPTAHAPAPGGADRRVSVPSGAGSAFRHSLSHPGQAEAGLAIYRRRLPHWRLPGSVYFVTWRLRKDQRQLGTAERDIVLEAVRWFAGERYRLFAWVVMDDHVHVLVQMIGELPLEEQVRRWKSLTANRLQRECGYLGHVWQEEYFDRIVRDEDEFWEKAQYILNNATKRWPNEPSYIWAGWSAEGGAQIDLAQGSSMVDTAVSPTMHTPDAVASFTADGGHGGPPHQASRRYNPLKLMEYCTYPTDRWILWRLQQTIERASRAQAEYEFGDARQAVEDFFFSDFCDNYLELSKGRLYGEPLALDAHPKGDDAALRLSAQCALFICLSAVLRMFAPVLPHIAEECWSWYHAQWYHARSLHETSWPCPDFAPASASEQRLGTQLVSLLALVRKWKSEQNVSIKKPLERMTVHLQAGWRERFDGEGLKLVMGDLLATGNVAIVSLREGEPPADAVTLEGLPYAVSCELAAEQ